MMRRTGFGTVELIVAIVVIVLLLAGVYLYFMSIRHGEIYRKTELRTFVTEIGKGVMMYAADDDHGYYPGQQFGDSMKNSGVTGSEILAEAMWENDSNNNGKLDQFPPTEKYLAYSPEHILIDGSRYFIADPTSRHVDEEIVLADQRIVAYYPSILQNTGDKLETTFYVNQNTTDDPYTPNENLPESSDGGKFSLKNKEANKIFNYSSFLLVAPYRDRGGNKEFFREYNVTNIGRD